MPRKKHGRCLMTWEFDTPQFDVVCFGSATVDVFAHTDVEFITIKTHDKTEELIAYPTGSKILIEQLRFTIGGGGTNTAVTFSRMGLKTAYLGKVGKDLNGRKIIEMLKKENIEFIGVQGTEQTNYSIILDSVAQDRTILAFKKASDALEYDEVKNVSAKWIYSSSLLGISFDTLKKVLGEHPNTKFAFNPSEYQCKQGIEYLKDILSQCDVLILNRDEAILLVGEGDEAHLTGTLQQYVPIVCVTDGSRGTWCKNEDGLFFTKARDDIKIAETTGAGDAFASGFVAGLVKEENVPTSMIRGIINAESVIKHIGAKNKILTDKEVIEAMKKDKREVKQIS